MCSMALDLRGLDVTHDGGKKQRGGGAEMGFYQGYRLTDRQSRQSMDLGVKRAARITVSRQECH